MMSELSERFSRAVAFVKENGYAKTNAEIAHRLGVTKSTLSMATSGSREPTWDLLLDFCDAYPVNFWWLRSGTGSIVKDENELRLLKRIEELESMLRSARSADPRQ